MPRNHWNAESGVDGVHSHCYSFPPEDDLWLCTDSRCENDQATKSKKRYRGSKCLLDHCHFPFDSVDNSPPSPKWCCTIDAILKMHEMLLAQLTDPVKKTQSNPLSPMPTYLDPSVTHRRVPKKREAASRRNNRQNYANGAIPHMQSEEFASQSETQEEFCSDNCYCQAYKLCSKYKSRSGKQSRKRDEICKEENAEELIEDHCRGNINDSHDNYPSTPVAIPEVLTQCNVIDSGNKMSAVMDPKDSLQNSLEIRDEQLNKDAKKDTHYEITIKDKDQETTNIRRSVYAGGDFDIHTMKDDILCFIDRALSDKFIAISDQPQKRKPRKVSTQQEIRIEITQVRETDPCQSTIEKSQSNIEFTDYAKKTLKGLRRECLNHIRNEIKQLCKLEKLDESPRKFLPSLYPNSNYIKNEVLRCMENEQKQQQDEEKQAAKIES